MRALIATGVNQPLSLESIKFPPMGDRDVRVEIEASGVCHTDLSILQGFAEDSYFPTVLGHEGVGIVREVGKSVTRCKVGDRIIASFVPTCGVCWHCIRHESQHCEEFIPVVSSNFVSRPTDATPVLAMSGLGTFSECMQISEMSVVPVETSLPAEQLALIGCGVTTGVGAALWTAEVKPGSTVAVFGCGGVGQSVVQGAKLAGASRIFAVDPVALKRTKALALGATDAIDPSEHDPVEQLIAATGGRGVDYAIEVTGIPSVVEQAFHSVRRRGTAVAVGMPRQNATVSIPVTPLFVMEKRLIGSFYGSAQVREHMPMLVKFAETGRLDLASIVSKKIGLHEVNDAFEAMQKGEVIRSVIVPSLTK